jgi:DNA-binding transcriptional regulator PaaX
LLTHEDGHPPEIARQTGYFPKTIQMTLSEMAASGNIHAARKGREKHYRLDRAEWGLVRAPGGSTADGPEWVAWPQFYAAMTGIWDLLQNQKLSKASPTLQAAEWQKLMKRVQPLLAESKPAAVIKDMHRLTGADYLEAIHEDLIQYLTTQAP